MDVPKHSKIKPVQQVLFKIIYKETSIMKNAFPPSHGESIPLICTECKKMFIGPNPNGIKLFDDFPKLKKKAQCPKCGSKKVVPHPGVHF